MEEINNLEEAMKAIEDVSEQFDKLRAQAVELQNRVGEIMQRSSDIVVDRYDSLAKRAIVTVMKNLHGLMGNLPIAKRPKTQNALKLRDEIEEALLRGAETMIACNSVPGVGIQRFLDCDAVRSLMRERANNLAQALSERIVPDPVEELLRPICELEASS